MTDRKGLRFCKRYLYHNRKREFARPRSCPPTRHSVKEKVGEVSAVLVSPLLARRLVEIGITSFVWSMSVSRLVSSHLDHITCMALNLKGSKAILLPVYSH